MCFLSIAGPVQPWEAAVQVLSPASAPQGPAADQRAQPPGSQKRPDAPNGHGTGWPVRPTRTDPHYRKIQSFQKN